ncbi:hypothetical protein Pse7367_1486 [Thalassoporum mexicanum PCC 7367]|uniref:hypothetical protein n=1 Tax=Thalassoporum mexicanum TaxID=3457544 RepID=UPI00029FBAD9|nr:hypothetical protein [Pseudanabaena sp. PCC 7367]AFY69776.1 hypothetical protein Pse7367_1486 [Pseudanabaena sp. PCC 7367]
MNREVIQDFLNLPGIVGVALTNRRMRPYFQGLNTNLDERQQQALAQGILQVLENMPEGFDAFEFYFAGNLVFIYRLSHGLVLLVLTDKYLDIKTYRYAIAKVKQAVHADVYNTVAAFKLLLGSNFNSQASAAWSGGNISRPNPSPSPELATDHTALQSYATSIQVNVNSPSATSADSQKYPTNHQQARRSLGQSNNQSAQQQPAQLAESEPATKPVSAKSSPQTYKLDELLAAMNDVSKFTTQYLGKVVVKNYWRSCRPKSIAWLQEFELDRQGKISHPQVATLLCDQEQRSHLQIWLAAYIKRCKLVIRNFDQMLMQDCLSADQARILFGR